MNILNSIGKALWLEEVPDFLVEKLDGVLKEVFADILLPSDETLRLLGREIVLGFKDNSLGFFDLEDAPEKYSVVGELRVRDAETFEQLDEWLREHALHVFCWVKNGSGIERVLDRLRWKVCEPRVNALCRDLAEALEGYDKWEGELLRSDKAWEGGLPVFTQELYDSWMELQNKRQKALLKFRRASV